MSSSSEGGGPFQVLERAREVRILVFVTGADDLYLEPAPAELR
jgi:hypothetical protein